MTIRNFLDLSTGHLKPETRDLMLNDPGYPGVSMANEYGWFCYICEDNPVWDQDMKDCMAKARELGCLYILFDRDADLLDDLPYYE